MANERTQALFVISVAAELAGMHPQTLRVYESRGLVEPFRTPGGTRRYSRADIERLEVIQNLSEQGLNLEGIRQVIAMQNRIAALERKNEELLAQLQSERASAIARERQLHQSYRHEIVIRQSSAPDIRR